MRAPMLPRDAASRRRSSGRAAAFQASGHELLALHYKCHYKVNYHASLFPVDASFSVH